MASPGSKFTIEDLIVKRLWVEDKRIDSFNLGALVIRDENYDFNKIAEHEINTKWNECFSNAYKNIEECIIGKKVNKCDINSALQVHKILDDIKNEK